LPCHFCIALCSLTLCSDQAKCSLVDKANYKWTDGDSEDIAVEWIIGKADVSKPIVTGNYVYTGVEQTVTIAASVDYITAGITALMQELT